MTKKEIIKNFSRYADDYDKYDFVQRKAAAELLGHINRNSCSEILELGCGTGNYTLLLRNKFKSSSVRAVDISPRMIEVASSKLADKNIEFMVADAENLKLGAKFDLVTSSSCFQWFEDLERAILRYKALLKKDGLIAFSIFGPRTFWELNFALRSVLKSKPISADSFVSGNRIKAILGDNFKGIKIKEIKYEEEFPDLLTLLNRIKYTGVKGRGLGGNITFTRKDLKEISAAYLRKFRRIKATYQIFFSLGAKE